MPRTPAQTTLADLQKHGGWVWAYCEAQDCGHHVAIAIAPFAILWGLAASSDVLRDRLRCSKCGHLGVTLRLPGWTDMTTGFQPFPVEPPGGHGIHGTKGEMKKGDCL